MTNNISFSKKQKDEITDIVVDALKEVIIPPLADMHDDVKNLKQDVSMLKEDVSMLKEDVSTLKEDVKKLDEKVERVDRKIFQVTDRQADKLDDHEKRLKKLEAKRAIN